MNILQRALNAEVIEAHREGGMDAVRVLLASVRAMRFSDDEVRQLLLDSERRNLRKELADVALNGMDFGVAKRVRTDEYANDKAKLEALPEAERNEILRHRQLVSMRSRFNNLTGEQKHKYGARLKESLTPDELDFVFNKRGRQ